MACQRGNAVCSGRQAGEQAGVAWQAWLQKGQAKACHTGIMPRITPVTSHAKVPPLSRHKNGMPTKSTCLSRHATHVVYFGKEKEEKVEEKKNAEGMVGVDLLSSQ